MLYNHPTIAEQFKGIIKSPNITVTFMPMTSVGTFLIAPEWTKYIYVGKMLEML